MIYYLPIEPYPSRYTWQLQEWTETALRKQGVEWKTVKGHATAGAIQTGVVLDAHARSIYGTTQIAEMIGLLRQAKSTDTIYMHDMFTPGFEALPYVMAQSAIKPSIYVRCWAQSVDVNDFTFPMLYWMRHYEKMVDRCVAGIFVASTALKELLLAAGFTAPIYVSGLPFDVVDVRNRAGGLVQPNEKKKRVLFSSRWDVEKQPNFFMDMIEQAEGDPAFGDVEFSVCTGLPSLRSNDPSLVARARILQGRGRLRVYENCSKEKYYDILRRSWVQFNCAKQDFVSFTMLEASALGVASLVPAYLAFPEAMHGDARFLYVPWSMSDAMEKLKRLLSGPAPTNEGPALEHDATLSFEIRTMLGKV